MRHLYDLVGSVAAHWGVQDAVDRLGLPASAKYVVFLIDGLGELQLREYADAAPFLAGLASITDVRSGIPSTTAASLTAVATGVDTGAHGMAGYTCRIPGTNRLMRALKWDESISAEEWQPRTSVFEHIAAAGHGVVAVNQARFAATGLTRATQRGIDFVGFTDSWSRREAVVAAVSAMESGLVYTYESGLDHTGHKHGVGVKKWLRMLTSVDQQARELREALPADVTLIVTADHGMVNLPRFNRFDVDVNLGLMRDVDLMGGEARFRHLYTTKPDEVAKRWRDLLGERAEVRTLAEADDWFGPIDPAYRERFGDVLIAAQGDFGVFSTRAFAVELILRGFHGSTTEAERRVPVLHG